MTEVSSGRLGRLRVAPASGEPSFGLIATIPSIQTVQALASAGVDWLIIDMEHGPIDNSSAHAMIIATAGTATVPFVRLPWSHPWQAKPAMDLGALASDHHHRASGGDFKQAVAEAEAGILRSKVPLGGVARTPDQAKLMLDRGYRALVFGFDWMLLQQAAARFVQEVRK